MGVFFFILAHLCLASRSLLEGDEFFQVPEVIDELSGSRVLAMELVQGVPLDRCVDLDQETRNLVCGVFFFFWSTAHFDFLETKNRTFVIWTLVNFAVRNVMY